jgi:hypothetical protein
MRILTALVFCTVLAVSALPAAAQDDNVTSGETGGKKEPAKAKFTTADGPGSKRIHRSASNDDLYDAVANLSAPEKGKTVPWVVALTLTAAILGMGLKQSFRNRYEG